MARASRGRATKSGRALTGPCTPVFVQALQAELCYWATGLVALYERAAGVFCGQNKRAPTGPF